MKLLKQNNHNDPSKIIVCYDEIDDSRKAAFSFNCGTITNLTELLEEEGRIDILKVNMIEGLIRTQHDRNYRYLGKLDDNNPDIINGCKYILVMRIDIVDTWFM
ncbi:hypothetical protein GGI03_001691 [Coemansia sp. RSA 2337]|nr:hypothetical protein H4S03_002219 [Coemansia sp. S3946]KAJ2467202.1 hypothetical protein GGI03_001691 [Coemansia sp. RSA 2337]